MTQKETKLFISPLLFVLLLIPFLSCSAMTLQQWQDLNKKTFYFDRFTYSRGYMKKKKAFEFMKNTESEKIFTALENTLGINVNRDIYRTFIETDNPEIITARGFPVKDTYTWQAASSSKNCIRLLREEETGHEGMIDYRYDLQIISQGKVLLRFSGTEEESWETIPRLITEIREIKLPQETSP